MLAPIPDKRRDGKTSFKQLDKYLTVDKDTGEIRGTVFTSDNIDEPEYAAWQMQATASQNVRVKDPVFHFILAMQTGEHPTDGQFREMVDVALHELGRPRRRSKDDARQRTVNLSEHEWVAVVHRDQGTDHVHVEVNRVHPITGRAWEAGFTWRDLDRACRLIEKAHGWEQSNGLYRWDEEHGLPAPTTEEEREQFRKAMAKAKGKDLAASEVIRVTGKAEKMERYGDVTSLQRYIKENARKDVNAAIARKGAQWIDVHTALAKHGLELVKGEKGGYTVRGKNEDDKDVAVKASDALREHFKGKAARAALEDRMGAWSPAPVGLKEQSPARQYVQRQEPRRDPTEREEARVKRAQGRKALDESYRAYVAPIRAAYSATERAEFARLSREIREAARQRRKDISDAYKTATAVSASDPAVRLKLRHQAVREAAIERSFLVAAQLDAQAMCRYEARRVAELDHPWQTKREWVADRAADGDRAALAQLRGWQYQDKRALRDLMRANASDAGILAGPEESDHSVLSPSEADQFRAPKLRFDGQANRPQGTVTWWVNDRATFTDQGKRLVLAETLAEVDDAQLEGMLRFAAQKFGRGNVVLFGDETFKHRALVVAVARGVPVRFADPAQEAMRQQLVAESTQREVRPAEPKKEPGKAAPAKSAPPKRKKAPEHEASPVVKPPAPAAPAAPPARPSGPAQGGVALASATREVDQEAERRVAGLGALGSLNGARRRFSERAQAAIAAVGGNWKAVDWPKVENEAMAEHVAQRRSVSEDMAKVILQHSPGRAGMSPVQRDELLAKFREVDKVRGNDIGR